MSPSRLHACLGGLGGVQELAHTRSCQHGCAALGGPVGALVLGFWGLTQTDAFFDPVDVAMVGALVGLVGAAPIGALIGAIYLGARWKDASDRLAVTP